MSTRLTIRPIASDNIADIPPDYWPRAIAFGVLDADQKQAHRSLRVYLPGAGTLEQAGLETDVAGLTLVRQDAVDSEGGFSVDCKLDPSQLLDGPLAGKLTINYEIADQQRQLVIPVSGYLKVAQADESPDSRLDEIIAGAAANIAAIMHGEATYDIQRVQYQGDKSGPVQRGQAIIQFRGDSMWWQQGYERSLVHRDKSYLLRSPSWDNPDVHAARLTLMINDRDNMVYPPRHVHPGWVGHVLRNRGSSTQTQTISDALQDFRSQNRYAITVVEEDALLKVSLRIKESEYKHDHDPHFLREYWINPAQGYSVVLQREWGLPLAPHTERETTYIEAVEGVFVADHQRDRHRGYSDDKVLDLSETETKLVKVNLTVVPAQEEFTPEGLGVVAGARVLDKVQGGDYEYEVVAAGDR